MMNKVYIANNKDALTMTLDLLNRVNPLKDIDKNIKIALKPNLVCATPSWSGATTHVEIAEGVIIYLQNKGFENITILESSWVGDSTKDAFEVCGYNALSKKYNVPMYDMKDDSFVNYGENNIKVCKKATKVDCLINLPLIKGHCQTSITCALKNMKGLIPDSEKRRFHTMGLHKPIAELNKYIKQDLIIADGICPDTTFEEGGNPVNLNTIALCNDPVLMDCYAAKMLGYKPFDIKYIKLAHEMGIGQTYNEKTEIINIYNNKNPEYLENTNDKKYLNLINDNLACSACYANLCVALDKLYREGYTEKFVEEIAIGQGYLNKTGNLGVGNCTKNFKKSIKGCPPSVEDIYNFLKKY